MTAAVPETLQSIRRDLDDLDRELIELLARRLELGLQAARIKVEAGLPIVDPERKANVIAQAKEWAKAAGLSEDEVADIFERLVSLSGRAQLKQQR